MSQAYCKCKLNRTEEKQALAKFLREFGDELPESTTRKPKPNRPVETTCRSDIKMEKLLCPNCETVCQQEKVTPQTSITGLPIEAKMLKVYHRCTHCQPPDKNWNFIVLNDGSLWDYYRGWRRRKDKPRFQYLMY